MTWVWYGALIGLLTGIWIKDDIADIWHELKMWRENRRG